MLRPHTFPQIVPSSFTVMVRDNEHPALVRSINASNTKLLSRALQVNQRRFKVLGFYLDFKAKTQR